MARCVKPWAGGVCVALALAGCGFFERAERPAWRTQAENACFAEGLVKPSSFIEPLPAIDGPGICGMTRPLRLSALSDGQVLVDKSVTIDCSMVAGLEAWLADVLQPLAEARFGERIVAINAFGAYSCRSVDNLAGLPLSEHAFGNAIDISGFTLASGRKISVVSDWGRDGTQESAFLHDAEASACERFTTVLGPGADGYHVNHFHLDLAMHGRTDTGVRRICRPAPAPSLLPAPSKDGLPPAPDVDEPIDVSRAKDFKPGELPLALHADAPLAEAYDPSLAPAPVLPLGPTGALGEASNGGRTDEAGD